jgi:hypothetical protein
MIQYLHNKLNHKLNKMYIIFFSIHKKNGLPNIIFRSDIFVTSCYTSLTKLSKGSFVSDL